jgi:hypothetical protein
MKRLILLTAVSLLVKSVQGADAQPSVASPAATLNDAPANTWVKVLSMNTGGREQPLLVYAGNIGKFVRAAGVQATGGVVPRHYDTEEFDLAAGQWFNAYPPAVAAGRPVSGPVGDEYSQARAKDGYNGPKTFYKDGDLDRPTAGGQWARGATYGYEWCYVPDNGKAYLYTSDRTLVYDVAARTWQDTQAEPRAACKLWGALCYDPVNKEILHAGGDGSSDQVSTWVYSIEKNEWRKLEFGSAGLRELSGRAVDLCWQAKTLVGACANRFDSTETAAEARVDLSARAGAMAADAAKFAAQIRAAGLAGTEKTAGEVAAQRLESAAAAFKAAGPTLSGQISPPVIASVRAARVICEQVVDALASEPPGRARSQTAYDAVHRKIVLFGGDGLDRVLSDTWVYDCATRIWEQKFPAKCPAPRAGHILVWLPKGRSIVLAGGYSRVPLPQEIWTYDVAANEWKLLAGAFGANAPGVTSRQTQVGAVNEDDVLICTDGPVTWGCKVNPGLADEKETAARAVTSGSYVFNRIDPATWEKAASPDPAKAGQFLRDMPANQWTAFSFPMYAPGARNRWGTTAYDTDRHQFLFWGGGHATSQENDVAHFSVLGGFWTIGYNPDDPIEIVYAEQPTPVSFRNRRHVPIHAYKAYAYDPTAGKMFYFDRAYNPAVREWEAASFPGLDHRGPMNSFITATPQGAVVYSSQGLFRFDAKAGQWRKLAWTGPNPGGIWCDGHALKYDSKRNCLWLANDKDIYRYDMATGTAEKLAVRKPAAIGQWIFGGEEVYLPDADLILSMSLHTKPDGTAANYAWSPEENRFFWVTLPFVENGKPVDLKGGAFSWSDALAYDPELKLVLLNNSSAQKVWGLKFDRQSARLEEMQDPDPR